MENTGNHFAARGMGLPQHTSELHNPMHPTLDEASAIEKFVLNVTIPIVLETGDEARLHATGTLFQLAGRQFVITARHIFSDLSDWTKLAFPEAPLKGRLNTFGNFNLSRPREESFDIAIMELLDDETIEKLKDGWQFLSLDNVALPSTITPDGSFFLSGYPTSLTKMVNGWLHSTIATVYTQRITNVPPKVNPPIIPGLDLCFEYGHEATCITGKKVQTPKLHGASGASVWEYKPVPSSVWTPESVTRVVGVQSGYLHSKLFLAKNWWTVSKALVMIDHKIAQAVQSKLHDI
jgi:hypothetical protein